VASAGEIGDFISANMTAVNVQGDFINVTKSGTGGGNVDSADKRISCGSKCVSPYAAGTVMTLTAKANSGSTFSGWTGACTGTGTCTVTVNGAGAVGAVFNAQAPSGGGGGGTTSSFQLKVSVSNSGTVTSDIGGINCGTVCQANYVAGTTVSLTATPPAGKTFASWSGACTGTAPSCTVTVNGSLSAKANFNK
jgi:endoglucanase